MTDFCSQYSRQVDEPLAGTGGHPVSNLLLSWPIGDWSRTFYQANSMGNETLQRIGNIVDSGRRINLMDRPDQPKDSHRAYLMPERRAFEIPTAELNDFLDALHTKQNLGAWEKDTEQRKVILCCTHGKKDKCCAKFGNASFKAMDTAIQKNWAETFEVWKSTHLGGCRLASAAVVFPNARKYGRIDVEHTQALLESEFNDTPYLPCYRGNGSLTQRQQIADIEARKILAEQGIHSAQLQITAELEQVNYTTVNLDWQSEHDQGQLNIQLQAKTINRYGACTDISEKNDPITFATWQKI
jgi:hypothetical protein